MKHILSMVGKMAEERRRRIRAGPRVVQVTADDCWNIPVVPRHPLLLGQPREKSANLSNAMLARAEVQMNIDQRDNATADIDFREQKALLPDTALSKNDRLTRNNRKPGEERV